MRASKVYTALALFAAVVIVAAILALSGCASSSLPAEPTIENLPAPNAVTRVEQATRALVMAQQIRVAARDYLAARIKADGAITDAETAQAALFDRYDATFTAAWRTADQALTIWQRIGGDAPADFTRAYGEVVDLLVIPNGLRAVAMGVERAEIQ